MYNRRNMKRTNLYLPIPLLAKMKAYAASLGLPVSELVRLAIADYLERRK